MELQEEHPLDCPCCGEMIVLLVDRSIPIQSYVEDCQVCCRPLVIDVRVGASDIQIAVRPEND